MGGTGFSFHCGPFIRLHVHATIAKSIILTAATKNDEMYLVY